MHNYKDAGGNIVFKELSTFVISLLCLPYSNAEVERLFSQMNLIKSKIRNKMNLDLLNAILSIRTGLQRESKCCFDFDISEDLYNKVKTNSTYINDSEDDLDVTF